MSVENFFASYSEWTENEEKAMFIYPTKSVVGLEIYPAGTTENTSRLLFDCQQLAGNDGVR